MHPNAGVVPKWARFPSQCGSPRVAGATDRNERMNKTELIEHLASKHELTKAEAGRILETLLDAVVTNVKKGNAVTLPGFGSFKQHARAARNGVNPSTGAKIKIAAAKLPKFTPGAGFKAAVDPKAAARKAAKAPAPKKAAPAKKAKKG
nr:HU family DNA-binding protein [Rhizobacter sp. Root1221]